MLGDDQPRPETEQRAGFREDHLDQRRILAGRRRQLPGARGGPDLRERHRARFGLGDDLVGDHQHIAPPRRQIRRGQSIAQDAREVVARTDRRNARYGRERDRRGRCRHRRYPKRTRSWSSDRSLRRGGWLMGAVSGAARNEAQGALGRHRAIEGGSLTRLASDRPDQLLHGRWRQLLTEGGTGGAGDRFVHQRAAEIVRPGLEAGLRAARAHLDPGGLDVGDLRVQRQARDRMHQQAPRARSDRGARRP